jgi:phosphotransferase system enzyme I (PtsP)
MVEVPSLIFEIDAIAARADFLSVGTNDLLQYLFAADRDNPRVAKRFDPLSAASLRALGMIADAAIRAGKSATVCGEIGGKPLEAMALLALGYRALSMSPASIGPVKAMLLALDVGDLAGELREWLAFSDGAASLRPRFEAYAAGRDIPV